MPSQYSRASSVDITRQNPGVDNSLAAHADTMAGKRKCLPYLMVNMLGRKA